jgi:FkbM family methyltransferase
MGKAAVGRFLYAQIIGSAMERTRTVSHGGTKLVLAVPNALNIYRADTFSTKEPETLEWIDAIPERSVLWDIGANVGLYSCYAARRRSCTVFAFEPSVFNLEVLARNIFLNGLTDRVTIVPLPLSDSVGANTLNMTSTAWGGALSTFGKDYGHDGLPLQKIFEFRTIGLSMAAAAELLRIPPPDYVKMDVDGIEHLILEGGGSILRDVKGILIEINDEVRVHADTAKRILESAGLTLKAKRHAECFDAEPGAAGRTFNQIWSR